MDSKLKTFIDLVAEMRQNQRHYFKSRDYTDLDKSKKSERRVDAMIIELNSSPKLFDINA